MCWKSDAPPGGAECPTVGWTPNGSWRALEALSSVQCGEKPKRLLLAATPDRRAVGKENRQWRVVTRTGSGPLRELLPRPAAVDRRMFLAGAVVATGALLAGCRRSGNGSQSSSGSTTTATPAHWRYEGEESPSHWGELDQSYKACSVGRMQSPIDIIDPAPSGKAPPTLAYQPGAADVRQQWPHRAGERADRALPEPGRYRLRRAASPQA